MGSSGWNRILVLVLGTTALSSICILGSTIIVFHTANINSNPVLSATTPYPPLLNQHQRLSPAAAPLDLYAFTIRDSKRLVDVAPFPLEMHIYDFVDVYTATQATGTHFELFRDGHLVQNYRVPCSVYTSECYNEKLKSVFRVALEDSQSEYFFYMESDNELCVGLETIAQLAHTYRRYFISTGVGASGWIMHRTFVQDLLTELGKSTCPDCVAANMLIRKKAWSVTRRHYVAHTLAPSVGTKSLNHGDGRFPKHLPRCLEPHRGKWTTASSSEDQYGWDYFDYGDVQCQTAEIFPCEGMVTMD